MLQFLAAFVLSAALTLLVVRILRHRGAATKDHDLSGPQKVHTQPVARVGGLSVFATLLLIAAVAALLDWQRPLALHLALLAICGLPAFAAGLAEDLTKRVPPFPRLVAAAISALLAVYLLNTAIRRTDIWGLDGIAAFEAGATLLAMIAVAGMANAVNIIDGFNGLASMCVVIMLAALGYVAFQVDDALVGTLALAGIGAVLGFFLWNFPGGMIFLGDGGAYFLGFFVAELSILLLVRNPGVSPLFPLLVCVYPVFETLFSIYRRRFLRAVPPSMPDGIHLHSLIYRRVLRWAVGDRSAKALTRRNSATSPFLWVLCMLSVAPAVAFWDSTPALAVFMLLFALSYIGVYWRIVRFKSPRWMHVLARRPRMLRGDH
jgi:UDP-N-acetylmuramyl pentapeptide phosphotransferase/UDP-N-acetylglucosamine-1-phosphate transferase